MATYSSILSGKIPIDRRAWWAMVHRVTKKSDVTAGTEHTYRMFFIRSSANGHLDCFHILATVNCAGMDIGNFCLFFVRKGSSLLFR